MTFYQNLRPTFSFMDELLKKLNGIITLSVADEEALRSCIRVETYPKGAVIQEAGKVAKAFFYNVDGFVRLFYWKNGDEITAYFYPKGYFVSAYESFVKQQPSRINLQAVENTQLAIISTEAAMTLLSYSPKFEAISRIVMEDELIAHQIMIEGLLTLNPEERYERLITANPSLLSKVPQHHLASYIGVKPESFSRIKKRYLSRHS